MPTSVLRRAPRSLRLDARRVRVLADRMLRALELDHAELSVLLTDDPGIHRLNRRYRRKDRPTDVLAFELDGTAGPGKAAPTLGDVVISIDTAARQARAKRHRLVDEVTVLLAHGLLHLLGYDHARAAEKRRMDTMTRWLVAAAGSRSGSSRSRSRPD